MKPIVLIAFATSIGVAACGGGSAPPNAPASPDLVIPPIGSAHAPDTPVAPPAPPPDLKHKLSTEECESLTRKIIELTLDGSGIVDPKQREAIFTTLAATKNVQDDVVGCATSEMTNASLQCALDAKKLEEIHSCLAGSHGEED